MRRCLWILFTVIGCGNDAQVTIDAPGMGSADAPTCQTQGAIGAFYRRQPNPRLIAGTHTFNDGKLDTAIADPNLLWDGMQWSLYYMSPHGTTFNPAGPMVVRHATSPDLATWTLQDAPSFTVPTDNAAWDHGNAETPSIAYNPDAPADRKYLLLYSGANGTFPGYSFPAYSIGAAFSPDGVTFTRVSASDSPHGKAGLVFTGVDAYGSAGGAIVADPEVVYLNGKYELWFSSFACTGANCATVQAYGIGHATSTDGIHWTTEAAPITSLLRASSDQTTGGGQPTVVYDDIHCKWEMWLTSDASGDTSAQPVKFNNMAGVWHATSTNGTSWSINYSSARDLIWDNTASGEHLGLLTGADVALKGTGRYMAYVGFDDQNVPANSFLPTANSAIAGVMTLNLATRDAPP